MVLYSQVFIECLGIVVQELWKPLTGCSDNMEVDWAIILLCNIDKLYYNS